ncbi:hypothetical protein GO755_34960 [Spirosoma sp. HMF4905]|uniref:Uncharacterized protein n=1 Tax=Spirosoma arboris TaxID=2682092 RepID=A0A7K1SNA6_9BACT|nr:hypothetical protein [Spirosoma arboris]MVM35275.1 hypothetical protein [Spirosoma arboris]
MNNSQQTTPETKVQLSKPLIDPPLWYSYQKEYSRLELLSDQLGKSHRLSLHQEVVYNLLNSLSPYRTNPANLPDDVAQARITALQLVNYFLEQLIIANPLLLPMGYEIVNQDNYLSLIRSPFGGVISLRTDSMAPLLPKDTTVAFFQLKPDEWRQTQKIVSIYRYSDYDTEMVGRITNVTEESFTLKRRNPDWPDEVIPWSDVVRILSLDFLVGAMIEPDYE